MKKSTLLSLFLGTAMFTTLNAQVSRTIEVTVQDTVFLKTTKINYLLTLDTTMNMWDMYDDELYSEYEEYLDMEMEEPVQEEGNRKQKKRKEPEIQNIEVIEEVEVIEKVETQEGHDYKPEKTYFSRTDIIEILNKNKFSFEEFNNSNFQLGSSESSSAITFKVSLKDEEELKRLFSLFTDHSEIQGKVSNLEYESVQSKMNVIYKDLYDKALNETQSIAKISGLTVVKLMKVYEHQGEFDNYMDSYQDILSDLPYGIKEPKNFKGQEKVVERTFVFEVK